ncbi:MAG: MFS transporter [Candidatus Heimdallarchaeum aukensis]|uniref:MFS transporter n=1 Tax=Candidatus Heimdallarchaeum aukensis TaxID=2876573 RepID=A0A9Y1BLP3_9ARCH|nr:MAG: MFS transporter [Candidatus Heimdallarchaeum aukensis]
MSIVKKTNKKNVFLFSFYDIANTVYSQVIQSTIILRYIQIIGQVENGMTKDQAYFVFTTIQALSQILVVALIPLFGAMMDRAGRKKPFVLTITGITLISTSLFWIKKSIAVVMTLFILANLAYWAALAAYDAMIPSLAAEKDIGKTSGIAMGLGWVSIIPAIGITILANSLWGQPNADPNQGPVVYGYYANPWTYIMTVGLFILFLIPFLFTKEKAKPGEFPKFKELLNDSFGELYRTFRDIRKHKEMFKFIIGYFFIVDMANTANIILLDVLRDAIGFPESQSLILQLPVVFAAIFVIPIIGWMGDKFGAKATVWTVGALYITGLISGIFAIWYGKKSVSPGLTLMFILTFVMMICVGIGLGSTWVVQRVMILKLAPPEKVGEYVGFSYIAGRLNASVAIFIWGGIIKVFYPIFNAKGYDYRTYSVGLLFLLFLLVVGMVITFFVKIPTDEERKKWAEDYINKGMKTQTELEKEQMKKS